MISAKVYDELFSELEAKTGNTKIELESYLSMAIAKAYNAINSALVMEDGTVVVAFLDEQKKVFLKEYVVSRKIFEKILIELNKLIINDVKSKDIKRFDKKIIATSFAQYDKKNVFAQPEKTKGFLLDYALKVSTNDLFLNDLKNIKSEMYCDSFFIKLDKINVLKSSVACRRFTPEIALKIFEHNFEKFNNTLGQNYSVKKNYVTLDNRKKSVEYFVEFRNKPSGVFVSKLSKALNKIMGNVTLHFKK